jgi:tRNA(fMet)-specific endonuclease VapC
LSIIVLAELLYGVETTQSRRIDKNVIKEFAGVFQILKWCEKSSEEYALIRSNLERRGELIGHMDMMIAAHAKSNNLTLVTNNYKHFSKVENLKLTNWVE